MYVVHLDVYSASIVNMFVQLLVIIRNALRVYSSIVTDSLKCYTCMHCTILTAYSNCMQHYN